MPGTRFANEDKSYLTPEKYGCNRLLAAMKDANQLCRFSDYGIQVGKDGIVFTLKANMGTWKNRVLYIKDNFGIRTITPLECLALQGFPKDFLFPDVPMRSMYKQSGNTVCVPIVREIAENLKKVMQESTSPRSSNASPPSPSAPAPSSLNFPSSLFKRLKREIKYANY